MPFMILYGGELVFLFLGARIARWMWRSREHVLALWRQRHGVLPSGPSFTPDPGATPIPLTRRAAAEPTRLAA
jgi:hypothetical protein